MTQYFDILTIRYSVEDVAPSDYASDHSGTYQQIYEISGDGVPEQSDQFSHSDHRLLIAKSPG